MFCSQKKKTILKTLDLIHNAGLRIEVLKFSEVAQLKALLIYVTRKKRQKHTKNKLELSWNTTQYNGYCTLHIALQRKRISAFKNLINKVFLIKSHNIHYINLLF